MYCDVDKAFDNPTEYQMKDHNNDHTLNNKYPSFFTAQGGIFKKKDDNIVPNRDEPIPESPNLFEGTSINELKNNKFIDNDSISLSLLNLNSDSESNHKTKKQVKYPHQYYIKKFIQDITNEDDDILSQTSSHDNIIYNHIRKCKYCKTQINQKMKDYYNQIFIKDKNIKKTNIRKRCVEQFENETELKPKSYELKEVIMIILVGIIIIFMLDLFFKMSKLMKKCNV